MIDSKMDVTAFNVLKYLAIELTLGTLLVPVVDQLIEYNAHRNIISGRGWKPTRNRLHTFRIFFNGFLVTSFTLILFFVNGALEFGTGALQHRKTETRSIIEWSSDRIDSSTYRILNSSDDRSIRPQDLQYLISELSSKFVRIRSESRSFEEDPPFYYIQIQSFSSSSSIFNVVSNGQEILDSYVSEGSDPLQNFTFQFRSPCQIATATWDKTDTPYFENIWPVQNTTNYTTPEIPYDHYIIAFNIPNYNDGLQIKCLQTSTQSVYKNYSLCLTWVGYETVWVYYGGLKRTSKPKYKWEHVIMSYIHEFEGFSIHVDEAVLYMLSFHNPGPLDSSYEEKAYRKRCYLENKLTSSIYWEWNTAFEMIRWDHLQNAALLLSKGLPTKESEYKDVYVNDSYSTAGVEEWALCLWIGTTLVLLFFAIALRFINSRSPIKSSVTSSYGFALMLQNTLNTGKYADENRFLTMRIGLKQIGPDTLCLGGVLENDELVIYEGQEIRLTMA